jgi:hypothetical protein
MLSADQSKDLTSVGRNLLCHPSDIRQKKSAAGGLDPRQSPEQLERVGEFNVED